jgi:hypothetical protein
MQVIPIQSVPTQTFAVVLAGQPCRINIYQRTTGLFADLYVNDALIIGGVICRDNVLIVRDAYLGFTGDLAFFDTAGQDDPEPSGLGSRWVLCYIETTDRA